MISSIICSFVLVIVLLSMRVKLDSFTLFMVWTEFVGSIYFATNTYDTMQGGKLSNIYLSLFACIIVTIVLAVAFRKYVIGKVRI